jgi:hypothetical protein
MLRRILLSALALFAAYLAIAALPDIKRYIKISSM